MVDKMAAGKTLMYLKSWLKENTSADLFLQLLQDINAALLLEPKNSQSLLQSLGITKEDINQVLNTPTLHKQFCREILLQGTKKECITKSKERLSWGIFYQVIATNYESAIINLLDILIQERHSHIQMQIADCLQYFLQNGYLDELLWKQCLEIPINVLNGKAIFSPNVQMHWDILVKTLISLPDHIANKLQLKASSIFTPSVYFNLLSTSIIKVLTQIHEYLQNSRDCSLTFVSQLFAKICATGKANVLYDVLVPHLSKWVGESPLWCRICSKLFLSIPDLLLETSIEPFIKKSLCPELVCKLLGDAILSRPKLKFLLTHKFLFMRTYSDDWVAYNIIGYISNLPSGESCFKQVLYKLLDVWGDRSSIKHTSYEQHLYISKCLLMSLSCLTQQQKTSWKSDLILKLMEGVPGHLECPDVKIRELGMIVAECLTSIIDKNGKQLKFEMQHNKEMDYLYELARNSVAAMGAKSEVGEVNPPNEVKTKVMKNDIKLTQKEKNIKEVVIDDLDSDDDLEPINIEEEEEESSVNGVKSPVYLRDCKAGLLSSNDPNRLEACLKVLEKLVMKEPGDLSDVSVELVKILLHLEDQYNITDFYEMRRKSLLAITVKCPEKVSAYLANEFYAENFSINQRLDMLEIVANTAMRLSRPGSGNPETFRTHLPLPNIPGLSQSESKPQWQVIIDERVKNKTRRFGKGPTKEPLIATQNRFTDVAGMFFFPFLKNFGMKVNTCDLLGDDCMVLGKFVYTLGVVLQASDALPVAAVMGKSLIDLIWSLRYHKEAFVRQSLIYAISMVVLHVPCFTLLTEMHVEIVEARDWLTDLMENDPNVECRKLSASCLVLMEKTFQKGLVG